MFLKTFFQDILICVFFEQLYNRSGAVLFVGKPGLKRLSKHRKFTFAMLTVLFLYDIIRWFMVSVWLGHFRIAFTLSSDGQNQAT